MSGRAGTSRWRVALERVVRGEELASRLGLVRCLVRCAGRGKGARKKCPEPVSDAKKPTYETIVSNLVEEAPDLRALYEEHLRDYGAILAHVFFGDLTRFVQDAFAHPPSSAPRQIGLQIVALLERAMSSDDEQLQELVSTSFLENLDRDGNAFNGIRASLGPTLKKELEA
jgi:hypothetical protein